MREIKFRRYSDEIDRMIYDLDLRASQLNSRLFPNMMQYTGLKDKNGKEIYEGDIVQIFKYTKGGLESKDRVEEILFDNGMFTIKGSTINLDFYIRQFGLEIIGNIYENPELLGEENERS